ncbi:sigma-54 interaction domain-containing protein [Effusibacillus lacus]|uniref:HTH-type transcriptional regulatory protein TyrR n=1 Tax=Effusibacillus lacus TaxID=1348429 RepID=A0A292YLA1_9BACL|nr:sigma 54-interacting transcriptional regulator [Effusibacillus lacus]TCS71074.1 PAS domain S-box-containing protein [Effusibacillus lacus]GAX90718.1 PAS modulated sigma54 specific transcriptional regulator, Fis family [Effusibacillus lacus]
MIDLSKRVYESELLLKHLIDSLYDGIYITDGNGLTTWYNKAFLRISGLTPAQLDAHTVFQLLDNGWLPNSVVAEAIRKRKTVTSVIDYFNGSEGLVSAIPVFDDAGNLLRVIANVRDLTELNELKRQLDETRALNEGYRQTLQEVQSAELEGGQMIYRSHAMERIISLAKKIASTDTPILILGESGVGKDVLAKYIHYISDRQKKGTFVKVNCGAIPEHLLESELFGYEAGAFTGAGRQGKAGLFEVANNGTVFLDEIGEMPLSLQVKLLGVLQDMEIQRLGGTKPIPIDVRIIAATNAHLETLIQEKRFRKDLFYRLNVLILQVPPLRERKDDVVALLMHFFNQFNNKHRTSKILTPAAVDKLLAYEWPGNVRELKNMVERIILTSDKDAIDEHLLPVNILSSHRASAAPPNEHDFKQSFQRKSLKEILNDHERQILSWHLTNYRPLKRCAETLGIDLATLVRKKKKYGL